MQIQAVPDLEEVKIDVEARNRRVEKLAGTPANAPECEPVFLLHPVRAVKLNGHRRCNIDTDD